MTVVSEDASVPVGAACICAAGDWEESLLNALPQLLLSPVSKHSLWALGVLFHLAGLLKTTTGPFLFADSVAGV